jgi:hypothetical protein
MILETSKTKKCAFITLPVLLLSGKVRQPILVKRKIERPILTIYYGTELGMIFNVNSFF